MEYAEGGSLHNFLHGKVKPAYSLAHAMSWARQCAEVGSPLHTIRFCLIHDFLTIPGTGLFACHDTETTDPSWCQATESSAHQQGTEPEDLWLWHRRRQVHHDDKQSRQCCLDGTRGLPQNSHCGWKLMFVMYCRSLRARSTRRSATFSAGRLYSGRFCPESSPSRASTTPTPFSGKSTRVWLADNSLFISLLLWFFVGILQANGRPCWPPAPNASRTWWQPVGRQRPRTGLLCSTSWASCTRSWRTIRGRRSPWSTRLLINRWVGMSIVLWVLFNL